MEPPPQSISITDVATPSKKESFTPMLPTFYPHMRNHVMLPQGLIESLEAYSKSL
jgi:hypothetical protein